MATKDNQSLKPVNVTLYGRRNFAYIIKLRILQCKMALNYLEGFHVITKVLIRGKQEVRKERWCAALKIEKGSQHPNHVGSCRKLADGEGGPILSSLESPKECSFKRHF